MANAEVPVGAVVVCNEQIVGHGANAPIAQHDPTAHAEMLALRTAAERLGNYRLDDCELYVTLEPCAMCAGAMLHARLKRVIFGAPDGKTGAAGSVLNVFAQPAINHRTQVLGGVCADECGRLLQRFFSAQRQRQALEKSQPGRAPLRDDALRTGLGRFAHLPDLPAPSFFVHDLPALAGLQLHYLDSGPAAQRSALVFLHGPASWCLSWHTRVTLAIAQGQRVICPDLIGFGKSDKPKKASAHRLPWHADTLVQLFQRLQLRQVTLLAPADMQALAQRLRDVAGDIVTDVQQGQPDPLPPDAMAAPFPDPGHQAALRAFSATGKSI